MAPCRPRYRPRLSAAALTRACALVVAVWIFAGCSSPPPRAALDAPSYPTDFTLEFFVAADEPLPGESTTSTPADRPAQHVVTPDRRLRVALGPGVSPRFHPPTTALLTRPQMADLHPLAEAAAEAEADLAPISAAHRPAVAYRLRFNAHGRSTAMYTTPDRNPAARALLDRLVQLRGGPRGRTASRTLVGSR